MIETVVRLRVVVGKWEMCLIEHFIDFVSSFYGTIFWVVKEDTMARSQREDIDIVKNCTSCDQDLYVP